MARAVAAARSTGLGFRMTEGNTSYRGGKPGLSDAFASALWAADYMLRPAALGAVGVNRHGGGSAQVRQSLGDQLPGEAVAPGAAAVARDGSFYTPVTGSRATGFVARPVFYGVKLAGLLAGGTPDPAAALFGS